jgi:hypothetical protein
MFSLNWRTPALLVEKKKYLRIRQHQLKCHCRNKSSGENLSVFSSFIFKRWKVCSRLFEFAVSGGGGGKEVSPALPIQGTKFLAP